MAASRARFSLSLCSRIARSRTVTSTRTLLLDKNRLARPLSAVTTSDFASFATKRLSCMQFSTTSIVAAIDANTVVEDPGSRVSSTGGGVTVTENEDDDDPFMQEQIRRYDRCRRWLAAVMGENVENFTDKDVQEAINYLMPSSLYAKDARPLLVHPSELFKKSRGQLFDATGRPSSAAFYTGRIGYHDLIYDIYKQFEKLENARLEAKTSLGDAEKETGRQSGESDVDEKEEKQNERPMRWIKKIELENILEERLDDREYEVILYRLKKLAAQPDAYLVYDFIKKYIFPVFTPGMKQVSLQAWLNFSGWHRNCEGDYCLKVDEEGRAHGIGHRKRAIAEVWVKKGSGQVTINGIPVVQYFGRLEDRKQILFPFQVVDGVGHYDAECNVIGGGPAGQAGAIRLAISRALLNFSVGFQQPLLDAGLLIRDPRIVERKKPGQKKARKKFAWVKR